ncbi:MAG: hypothetical protein ACFFDT_38560, partial [Candidatus Hodarchaeota archaeon]
IRFLSLNIKKIIIHYIGEQIMKKKYTIATTTIFCILTFFAMLQAPIASSQPPIYTPGEATSIITDEGVEFTETITGPSTLELFTNYIWTLRFEIISTYYSIVNIKVEETLSAELEVDTDPITPSTGTVEVNPMGSKPNKSAVNITWTIDSLTVNTPAYMELEFSTDLNNAVHQEYTSCGCYLLNSGPRLTYYRPAEGEGDPDRFKYSDWGWVWEVCVPCKDIPLFSDALWILPLAVLSGSTIAVLRRRR